MTSPTNQRSPFLLSCHAHLFSRGALLLFFVLRATDAVDADCLSKCQRSSECPSVCLGFKSDDVRRSPLARAINLKRGDGGAIDEDDEKRSPLASAMSFGMSPFAAPGKREEYSYGRGPFAAPGKRDPPPAPPRPFAAPGKRDPLPGPLRPFAAPGKRPGGYPFARPAWGGGQRRPFAAPGKRRTFTEDDAAVLEKMEREGGSEKRSPFAKAKSMFHEEKRNPFARLWSLTKRPADNEAYNEADDEDDTSRLIDENLAAKRSPLGAARTPKRGADNDDDNDDDDNDDVRRKAESRDSGFSRMLREEEGDEELGSLISEHVFCLLDCRKRDPQDGFVNKESKCRGDCLKHLNN